LNSVSTSPVSGSTATVVAELAGQRERPRPSQARRKIAKAFAEIKCRRVGGDGIGADALGTAAAPFDVEAHGGDELVLGILEHAVLERRLDVLKPAGAVSHRPARRIKMRPGGRK
jgi:hypothetical protein